MPERGLSQIIELGREESYHGSNVPRIRRFLRSEYGSLGSGFYITGNLQKARRHAERKAKHRGGLPIVYMIETHGMKLFNLAYTGSKEILVRFGEYLLERSKTNRGAQYSLDRHNENTTIGDEINKLCESLGKEIIDSPSSFMSLLPRLTDFGEYNAALQDFLKNRGYDGMALGEDYVIFDPSNLIASVLCDEPSKRVI